MEDLLDELSYYRGRMTTYERSRFDEISEIFDDGETLSLEEEEFLEELGDKFGL